MDGWMDGQTEGRRKMTNTGHSEGDKGMQREEQGKAEREIGRQVRTMTEVQGERD